MMTVRIRRPKHHHRAVFYPNQLGIAAPAEDGRALGFTQAWHRTTWEHSPYCIVNELVSAEIGRFLRLPVPAFAIAYGVGKQFFFSSLDFNFDRDELPHVEPDCCWEHMPFECTGVVLFDILIANPDRHDENLVVDNVARPREMRVFDHDQALLGGGDPNLRGLKRLTRMTTRLGISGSTITGGNRHCLIDELMHTDHFEDWLVRIDSLPNWFIDDVCMETRSYGMKVKQAKRIAEFLKTRRNTIRELVKRNQSEFTSVEQWAKPNTLL